MCIRNLFIFFTILIISITGLFITTKQYRENKILLTTFDNSGHYKQLSSTNRPKKNYSLVLFGDSRIKQWNPILELNGINVLNRGIAGETTEQMMLRFKKDVLDTGASTVVIQAGINDLVAASITNDYNLKTKIYTQCLNNLKKMVYLATQQKLIVILIEVVEPYNLGVIRSLLWGNDLLHLVQNINKELLTIADVNNIYLLNANKVLQNKNHQWKSGVNRDTLHFTAKAYNLLNVEITSLIEH